jgi:hypothetical protein
MIATSVKDWPRAINPTGSTVAALGNSAATSGATASWAAKA